MRSRWRRLPTLTPALSHAWERGLNASPAGRGRRAAAGEGFRRLLPTLALTVLALAAIAASGLFAPLAAEAAGPGVGAESAPGTTPSVSVTRSDGALTASWPAVAGATSYHVTYSSDGGASWSLAALDHPANANGGGGGSVGGGGATESITFAVDNASTYLVGVRAGNDQGWGGWRNSPASAPYKATTPPGTVASVEVSRADGTLTASWDAPGGADTYHVTHSSTGGASWELAALDHPASGGATDSITFYVDNAQTYIVGVRAKNGAGGSGWRNSPAAGPFTPPLEPGPDPTPTPSPTPDPPGPDPVPVQPAAPAGLTATAGDGSVTLAWDDPSNASITGYEYLSRIAPPAPGWGAWTSIAGSGASTVSHTVEGLTNGKEYRFKLRAVNASGESDAAPDAAPWFVSATPALQPPGQPNGLTAEANGDGSATITWTNPNDPSITGYEYEISEDGGAQGKKKPIQGSGASTTSHTVTGLTSGTNYNYSLAAKNASGSSTRAQISVRIPAILPGPDSVTITARGTGTLTATWTAVDGAYRYYIYTSNSSNWNDYAVETHTTGTSVTLDNRDDSLNYTVLVWATTDYGQTKWVESWPAGTSTSPAIMPESVSLSRSGTTLTATWPAVVGAASYNVASSSDNGVTWTSEATAHTTTTWTKSSIDATRSYIVRVQSKNTTGTSAWTESDENTPAPPAPASVTLGTRSGTTLNVSWSAVTRATSYNVQSSSDNGTTWSASTSVTGTTTALTIDATKDYFVRVQAVNSSGTSGWTTSALSRATPLPPAPANLTYTRAKGSITLTWDAATGAASYDVACSGFGGNIWEVCKEGVTDAQRTAGVTITQFYNRTAGQMRAIADYRNYVFAVRGRNASGAGEWTRVTAWTTRPDRIASVTATSRDADGITLSMTVPADKGGYSVTRIHVECRTSSDGGTTWSGWFACTDAETQANPAGGSTLTTDIDSIDNYDTTLAYQARARAHNALGYTWDWRESATIHTVPGAPTINNYASTILAWSEPSDTGSGPSPKFNVYCRADADDAWTKKVDAATVPTGQTSHITSLVLHSECTNANSQVAITIVNGFESARAYWPRTSLAASGVTVTGATLTIANNHSGSTWYYKADAGPDATCQGPVSTSTETLTGLTGGTTYTYKAYSDSTCTTANLLATATAFTTTEITLTAGSIGTTTATLTLANHTGNWYAKKTAPSTGTCSSAISGATHDLSSLTAGTWYTYRAYSDSGCTTANELASEAFSTAVTVSNHDTNTSVLTIGIENSQNWAAAQAFTTGTNSGGYTLTGIVASFAQAIGNPGNIVVKLHAASGDDPGTELATLTGSNPPGSGGNSTYTCSGSGCALDGNATYFIAMSAPSATGSSRYFWKTTQSNSETLTPSGNGWSIADDSRHGIPASSYWSTGGGSALQMQATAVPEPSLASSSVTTTTATLTLTGHAGDWWLKRTTPTGGTCTAGESDFSHALSSLNAGTQYTYTAYGDSGCSTGKKIASASFATPPGVPTNVSVGNSGLSGTKRNYPVSWGKPSGAQASDAFAYQVQCTDTNDRNTTDWGDCGTQNVASTANASVSKTVQHGWLDGLFQYVRVRAEKHGVYSAWVIQKTQYGS